MIKYLILLIIIVIIIIIIKFCYNRKNSFINIPQFKIDIVYTWAGEYNNKQDVRTSFNNELKYSLRSVFKNMKWFNHIFIVINTPIESNFPSWFNEEYSNKITLIDQKQIFPKERYKDLPCKFSDIIETYVHLIPKLSEHFIYLNDDFFINKPLNYNEFFNESGNKIKVVKDVNNYGKMNFINTLKFKNYPFIFNKPWYNLRTIFMNKLQYHPHILYPMTISSRKKYIEEYSEWINWVQNLKYDQRLNLRECSKFGLYSQCVSSHSPYYIYMYLNNNAIINQNLFDTYIEGDKFFKYQIRNIKSNTLFFVINNTKSNYLNTVTEFLEDKYPNKLYFEK